MKKKIRILITTLIILLISCDFGYEYDNPVDKESENYQGYETVTDVNRITVDEITKESTTLSWSEVVGTTKYHLKVGSNSSFSTIYYNNDELTTNTINIKTLGLNEGENFCKIRVYKESWSDWSDVFSFYLYSIYYAVGDIGPTGGYIFYVDSSDSYDGWRFLEAAPEDISGTKVWGTYGTAVLGAEGTAVGTGAQNTLDIIASDVSTSNAAHVCADYSVTVDTTTYDDWFLPSKDELDLMYDNLKVNGLGGFKSSYYWSSSEYGKYLAWQQNFRGGAQHYENKGGYNEYYGRYVRPVRAF